MTDSRKRSDPTFECGVMAGAEATRGEVVVRLGRFVFAPLSAVRLRLMESPQIRTGSHLTNNCVESHGLQQR